MRAFASDQGTQCSQVHPVLPGGLLRRFQNLGNLGEPPVVQEEAKGVGSDPSPTDVLVPVDAAAEGSFRVIYVYDTEPFEPQDVVEGLQGFPVATSGHDGVSRDEDMARIQTDGDTVPVVYLIHDVGQMFESIAQ